MNRSSSIFPMSRCIKRRHLAHDQRRPGQHRLLLAALRGDRGIASRALRENHRRMGEKPGKTLENLGKPWNIMGKPWKIMEKSWENNGVYDKMIQHGEKTWKLQRNFENMCKFVQSLGFHDCMRIWPTKMEFLSTKNRYKSMAGDNSHLCSVSSQNGGLPFVCLPPNPLFMPNSSGGNSIVTPLMAVGYHLCSSSPNLISKVLIHNQIPSNSHMSASYPAVEMEVFKQGLVNVPFWEYWTSPEKVAI